MLAHSDLTAELVREWLDYCPDSGGLHWKKTYGNARKGAMVGVVNHHGYRVFGLKGKQRQSHRIIWLHVYGAMPPQYIDHINGVKHDNRISNLRLATPAENAQNRPTSMGVTFHKRTNKWQASITLNGRLRYLGLFCTLDEARAAYLGAKIKHHAFWVHADCSA
jgi:hypothetical protein